eukprot:TRINITY_DN998_c0_g1_i6.p1 TRINITY_DN998_c0_g1~~TRINITY_DN998_c0_g1_i6.p1  ORF type:complete len:438 (+),score=122.04 TRINITY_DN998_c0_g1_i6:75-1316(+)
MCIRDRYMGIAILNEPLEGDRQNYFMFYRNFFFTDLNPVYDLAEEGVMTPIIIALKEGVKSYELMETESYTRPTMYDINVLSAEFAQFDSNANWYQEWNADNKIVAACNFKMLGGLTVPMVAQGRHMEVEPYAPAPTFWLESNCSKYFEDIKASVEGEYNSGGKPQWSRLMISRVKNGLKMLEPWPLDNSWIAQSIPATSMPYVIETSHEMLPMEGHGGNYYGLADKTEDVCRKMYFAFALYDPEVYGLNGGIWLQDYEVVLKEKVYKFRVTINEKNIVVSPQGGRSSVNVQGKTYRVNQACTIGSYDPIEIIYVEVGQFKGNEIVKLNVRVGEKSETNPGCLAYLSDDGESDMEFRNTYRLGFTYNQEKTYGTDENPMANWMYMLLADIVGDPQCKAEQDYVLQIKSLLLQT